MNNSRQTRILKSIADEAVPQGEVDLWPQVRSQLTERSMPHRRRRSWGPVLVRAALPLLIVAALLVTALVAVGPEQALAALQRLLGYIPGIGLVDDSAGLRILAETVSQEREGITVTVKQAVLDAERTVVIYRVEGIPPSAFPVAEDAPFCSMAEQLHLADGTSLQINEGTAKGWGSGYESRLVFSSLDPQIDEAIFLVPCLQGAAPGQAPQDWELALRFIPAPPDTTIVPVLEITPPPEATSAPAQAAAMGLYLEQVIELEDSFILMGTFQQGDELPEGMVVGPGLWLEIKITDADGQPVPYEVPSDLDTGTYEAGVLPWAYQIPKGFAAPLTLRLDAVEVMLPADTTFQLDVGPDPRVGQEWTLNMDLTVAGYPVHLASATLRERTLDFRFQAGPEVTGVSVSDEEHVTLGGGGGGGGDGFTSGIQYADPMPTGLLTLRIAQVTVRHAGPWSITWEPPAGADNSAPPNRAGVPQACLTLDIWLQAVGDPAPLPADLGGRLVAYGRIRDDGRPLSPDNAGVFVTNPDGSGKQILGQGTWPSLSPDGTLAAYGWTDGLHVVDLASGTNSLLPGTSGADYGPQWSPDGSQIAFVRTDALNLYVIQADGSGLRQLTTGREYEQFVGWLPDGAGLAYAVPVSDGMQLLFLDLSTGQARAGFLVDSKAADAAISPDGSSIAFTARVPGRSYGLYLSGLDGTERRLVAQLDNWSISDPVWSPDGAWLVVSMTDTEDVDAPTVPALISLESCQAIPLAGIEGYVQGWAP